MSIKTEFLRIGGIPDKATPGCQNLAGTGSLPAVLYGEKSDKVYLYLHGKQGCKEEAAALAPVLCGAGWQILAVDLPEHGERKNDPDDKKECFPWTVIPEWKAVVKWLDERYSRVALCAVSVSAWFVMRTFRDRAFDHALFISPIADLRLVIEDMMARAGVTASDLGWKQHIPTAEGEMLHWDYYAYAAYQPINRWDTPTEILYAERDALQPRQVMEAFAARFGCRITAIPGEHRIPPDSPALQTWLAERALEK